MNANPSGAKKSQGRAGRVTNLGGVVSSWRGVHFTVADRKVLQQRTETQRRGVEGARQRRGRGSGPRQPWECP